MGNPMLNSCVAIILTVAALSGLPSREIHTIVFFILWPAATAWLVVVVWQQQKVIQELERKCLDGALK